MSLIGQKEINQDMCKLTWTPFTVQPGKKNGAQLHACNKLHISIPFYGDWIIEFNTLEYEQVEKGNGSH